MKNGKKQDFSRFSLTHSERAVLFLLITLCAACSGHGIYIINDPLSANEHNDLAVIYEEKGEFDLAIEHLSKAIKKDRNNPLYRTNRGNVLLKTGDENGALKDFEKAIEIDPDFLDGINNLCYVRASRRLPLRSCPDLIERQLKNEKPLPWQFYDTAGLVYTRMRKPGKAKEMYEGAISLCGGCSEKELEELNNKVDALEESGGSQ